MPNTKKVVVVPKLSAYERRNLHSIGVKTFVKLAELDPIFWKYRLNVSTFKNNTVKQPKLYVKGAITRKLCGMNKMVLKMKIREKTLLDVYHYKSNIDRGTRLVAGLKYLRLHPNAIMPPML